MRGAGTKHGDPALPYVRPDRTGQLAHEFFSSREEGMTDVLGQRQAQFLGGLLIRASSGQSPRPSQQIERIAPGLKRNKALPGGDQRRHVAARTSANPGRWKTKAQPCAYGPMAAITEPDTYTVSIMADRKSTRLNSSHLG